jgi:hypothetical protein
MSHSFLWVIRNDKLLDDLGGMFAVALTLCDQVPQVRHGHVGAVLSDQSFFTILALAVAARADEPDN